MARKDSEKPAEHRGFSDIIGIVLIAGAVGWWLYARTYESTDDAQVDGHITPIAATVPGYDVQTWLGLAAPKGTPPAIIQKLSADTAAGLADPEAKARLNKIGLDVHTSTPEAMRAMVAEQIAKWKKVVAEAHIPQQ